MKLITPFDPWKHAHCTCPEKFSLAPYTGCAHGCRYCYAASYIPRFEQVRPKRDYFTRLDKELPHLPSGSLIAISNSSDPYPPAEKHDRITRGTLERILALPLRVQIVTKSDLVARDNDLLAQNKNACVAISITSLRPQTARRLEPGAPPPRQRLAAIKTLSASGVPVACRIDPLIPALNTDEIEDIVAAACESGARQIITSTYKTKPADLAKMCNVFPEHSVLWKRLYLVQGEKNGAARHLEEFSRKELIERVRNAAAAAGLAFSSCREGFGEWNTTACDGSAAALTCRPSP